MIYRKNLFAIEQFARVLLGVGAALVPLGFATNMPLVWVLGGLSFALTGVFGFCPACYMVGRKTPQLRAPRAPSSP
jgi:Protein of unknown function (DUF2892)